MTTSRSFSQPFETLRAPHVLINPPKGASPVTEPQGLNPDTQGKVRDIYDLGDRLLLVASDRISAYDVILDQPIPSKGEVLTRLSLFWFDLLGDVVPNHFITGDVSTLPPEFQPHLDYLSGRSMIVKKAEVFPVECIVRGYVAGSGWKEYQQSETICGIRLPSGLTESAKLEEPIFTPSTKAEIGDHDENISFEQMVDIIGESSAVALKNASIALYSRAREHAAKRGIIIADTKFEFGVIDGQITLIDEVLTPDSSRFWPLDEYEAGHGQPSFDKQYVRDWLSESGWDKTPPPPELPAQIIEGTGRRYIEAYETITGLAFEPEGD